MGCFGRRAALPGLAGNPWGGPEGRVRDTGLSIPEIWKKQASPDPVSTGTCHRDHPNPPWPTDHRRRSVQRTPDGDATQCSRLRTKEHRSTHVCNPCTCRRPPSLIESTSSLVPSMFSCIRWQGCGLAHLRAFVNRQPARASGGSHSLPSKVDAMCSWPATSKKFHSGEFPQ